MENKKQDENSLEELSKAAYALQKCIVAFGNELSRALDDIKELKKEEYTWEMKCPYKKGHEYWLLDSHGEPVLFNWKDCNFEKCYLKQGNTFKTKEAAELEAKRRNLLTRFRAFRDECNGDWKSDWDINKEKYFLYFSVNYGIFCSGVNRYCYMFNLFGYFKNKADCERAIELFGDEIKELFVECDA